MNVAIITGSAGLIGSESVAFFSNKFDLIIGIDNNLRQYFFGKEASTEWNKNLLEEKFQNYKHFNLDIRDYKKLEKIFPRKFFKLNSPVILIHQQIRNQPNH